MALLELLAIDIDGTLVHGESEVAGGARDSPPATFSEEVPYASGTANPHCMLL